MAMLEQAIMEVRKEARAVVIGLVIRIKLVKQVKDIREAQPDLKNTIMHIRIEALYCNLYPETASEPQ